MSLSLLAHVACIVLILWHLMLLAATETAKFSPGPAKMVARVIITVFTLSLVVVWMALP